MAEHPEGKNYTDFSVLIISDSDPSAPENTVPYRYVENDTPHWEGCQDLEWKLNLWYS